MNSFVRFLGFILKTVIVLILVVGLCAAGFFVAMNSTNIYVLINDGLRERVNVILYHNDTENMSKYFTPYFMENDSYVQLCEKYGNYKISSFGYKVSCRSVFAWPWTNRTQIIVDEAVYAVDGTMNTSVMSKDEAMLAGVYFPPQWQNSTYRVTLIKQNDRWVIEAMDYISEYDYQQPVQRSLEPEELEAIRPSPTPTKAVTPAPTRVTQAPTPTPTPLYSYTGVVVNVKTDGVNVRKGPGTNYDSVGKLELGTVVTIVGAEGNWYRILWQGDFLYVSASYIHVDDIEE